MRAMVILAVLATGLASQDRALRSTAWGRSAKAFNQYFQALRQEPLNPVERVVFSLVLANANTQPHCHS